MRWQRSPATIPRPRAARFIQILAVVVAGCSLGANPIQVRGQDPVAAPADGLAEAPPTRQDIALSAKDGVTIHATYLTGSQGKHTVPVILLHGWDGKTGAGSRQDLLPLGLALQKAGHAAILIDLRGHGQSLTRTSGGQSTQTLQRDHFLAQDFRDMVLDVEAARSFLLTENNAGRLNIELLTVVGFEMSTVVALHWALYDWTIPSFPAYKQGQDVKAIALFSPLQSIKGLSIQQPLANATLRGELSALLMYGTEGESAPDARRLAQTLRRSHRARGKPSDEEDRFQTLFIFEKPTRLHGTKLLDAPTLGATQDLLNFLQKRLVDRRDDYPWQDRSLR